MTLNQYISEDYSSQGLPRIVVYPNNTIAAQLLNHYKYQGRAVVKVSDCIPVNDSHLPMPNVLMRAIDSAIQLRDCRAAVVGIESYLSLLDNEGVAALLTELRSRLDSGVPNADYLISSHRPLNFLPRYQESRNLVFIEGIEGRSQPLEISAYSDKWVKPSEIAGYRTLLERMGIFEPKGEYTLVLAGLTDRQAGIGNAITYVLELRDVAKRYYGIDAALDEDVLGLLLAKLAETGQSAENYLQNLFGLENINVRLSLKRLVEMPHDGLWQAYVWLLRRMLPSDSYIAKVISLEVTQDNLLNKYVVTAAASILSEPFAKRFALERLEALRVMGTEYESLIVEFVGITKDASDALPFLNCRTISERIEIIRRASKEDLRNGLPKQYAEIFPTLADYFSAYEYGDNATTEYFKEYRRLKVLSSITDDFVKQAYDVAIPKFYRSRDAVLGELQKQTDIGLVVVDAMGAEYMPLMINLAKRRSMNVESHFITVANMPTETSFNQIRWDRSRRLLPDIKCLDNVVHDGAEKHEASTPERSFAETLRLFESEVMNRISEGLARFARIVVTADHGASRLAVISWEENKCSTLPWSGQPDNWRYSSALPDTTRPEELVQAYYPETGSTYWIVRGYNRLPKMGGKIYELHGGATLEERLVPIVVFARNVDAEVQTQFEKKSSADVTDEFEGII